MEKTIEALEKLIAIKDETIKELEKQIQLLKNQPSINIPVQPSPQFSWPVNPVNPYVPYQPSISPGWPYGTIVTSGVPHVITGRDTVPTENVIWTTFTNLIDGTSQVLDLNKINRC